MKDDYKQRLIKAKKLIDEADYILIGAGAGLSTAAGFEYAGKTFEKYFQTLRKSMGLRICTREAFIPLKVHKKNGHIGQDLLCKQIFA